MTVLKIINLLVIIACLSSCAYDVEEEIYSTSECMTSDMSYQNDIEPILDLNCYVCHGIGLNQGGITLESYDELVPNINNGKVLGAINHASGFSAMPQGAPKLLECEIQKIEQWVADGAPNN